MKASNPTERIWFLETSVPRNLLFGHELIKNKIRKQLKGAHCWSSFYVLMEFKRSVVKTLIDFHSVILEEGSVNGALDFYANRFNPREIKCVLSAISKLLAESDLQNDQEKFVIRLRRLIYQSVEDFNILVGHFVTNRTRCPLAGASLDEGFDDFQEQIKCKTECTVERLWKESRCQLRKFVKEGNSAPHNQNKGFFKVLPLIKDTIGNPTAPKTITKCMQAGDFIIALEMPKALPMLTFDKAFDSICSILGKQVLVLPSLAQLKKDQRNSQEKPPESSGNL